MEIKRLNLKNSQIRYYYKEVGRYPLLTRKEEREIMQKIESYHRNLFFLLCFPQKEIVTEDSLKGLNLLKETLVSVREEGKKVHLPDIPLRSTRILEEKIRIALLKRNFTLSDYQELFDSFYWSGFRYYIRKAAQIYLTYLEEKPFFSSYQKLSETRNQLKKNLTEEKRTREKMITSNLRLVIKWAGKIFRSQATHYFFPTPDFSEMIQDGNFGLFRAVETFDYRKGNKFSTYAIYWIAQAIYRGLTYHTRTVDLPNHVIPKLIKILETEERLSQELQRPPTLEEIAQAVNLNLRHIEKIVKYQSTHQTTLSLDDPLDKEAPLKTKLFDEKSPNPETELFSLCLRREIFRSREFLNERERKILSLRFGFAGPSRTLEEISHLFGVTRERIRQIEQKALQKLSSQENLKEFLL